MKSYAEHGAEVQLMIHLTLKKPNFKKLGFETLLTVLKLIRNTRPMDSGLWRNVVKLWQWQNKTPSFCNRTLPDDCRHITVDGNVQQNRTTPAREADVRSGERGRGALIRAICTLFFSLLFIDYYFWLSYHLQLHQVQVFRVLIVNYEVALHSPVLTYPHLPAKGNHIFTASGAAPCPHSAWHCQG